MACVWKHHKSRFWFAQFRDAGGKVVNRSTRETDRRKAQQIADGWHHAARLARRGELTTNKARAVVSEILERVTDGVESIRAESTDKFFRRWLENKEAMKSAATAERYRAVLDKFLEHLGKRRAVALTAIRAADVQAFIVSRTKTRSSKTVAVDAKCLAAAFAYAVRQGLIDRNPVLAVELPKVESKERQPFTLEQVRLLVAAASADWKTCILAGYFTGARLSDLTSMEWPQLDLVAGVWRYRQRKTGESVEIPLHEGLRAHLESIAGDATGPVMPSLHGKGTGGCNGLSNQFNALMRSAGIAQDRTEQKSGRTFAALSFHSLRHSFESALANAGVSSELRRELAGRADEAVQKGYTHLQLETMRTAVNQLATP